MTARPKRDTVNPCKHCGWARHMAIHQPTSKGTPWCRYEPKEPTK